MKTKLLILLPAICLVLFAAWYVQRDAGSAYQKKEKELVSVLGGIPEKYRDTARKGLEYLVKNQHKDGHWEGDGGKHPVAMTGLAGIALLLEIEGHQGGPPTNTMPPKYAANIRKAADWLMEQSQAKRDGLIFSGHDSETSRYMEGHGLATIFLAGASRYEDETWRKKLNEVLTRAVKYIAKAQSSQGGWYHTSRVEGHDFDAILTTAIQLQALRAAENAGIAIPGDMVGDAQEYLKTALVNRDGKGGAAKKLDRPDEVAAALTGYIAGRGRRPAGEDEPQKKWSAYCLAEAPAGRQSKFGRDEITHYFFAQAIYRNDLWKDYRAPLLERIHGSQKKDGSWPAAEGISVGPVYATAMWCTILLLDQNSHPATRIFYVVT